MSKKKPIFSKCERCGTFFLSTHFQKHPESCEIVDGLQSIVPKKVLTGVSHKLEKGKEALPNSALGWHRQHTVLVNPHALDVLEILPRSPLILTESGKEDKILVVPWPCADLQPLRLNTDNFPAERLLQLEVVDKVETLKSLTLEPLDDISSALLKAPHFASFIQLYLNGAYISPSIPIVINYLAKSYRFEMLEDISKVFDAVGFDEESKIRVYQVDSNVTIRFTSKTPETNIELALSDPFDKIGGADLVKKTLNEYLFVPLERNLRPLSSILWGFTGCGKSLFMSCIQEKLPGQAVLVTSMKDFTDKRAQIKSDSILLIDFQPSSSDANNFADLICDFVDSKLCLSIVLTTRSIDSLDLRVRRRFEAEVELMVPSNVERRLIFDQLLPEEFKDRAAELARDTHGFTGADIDVLCRKAVLLKSNGHPNPLETARKQTNATGIKQFILEVPNVSWEDIGGNLELKEEIQQAVVWPYQHPEAFERLGVQPPNGILLYGPPGCSKTLIARALASQSKLNFLSVKGPELFSKWVGESERAVRDLFHRARQVSPAILFFDEIDAIATKRGQDKSNAVSDRVLAQMLTELDGLEKSARIFVVAATNRPDTLDGALLRPGRLDRAIYVPLPDYGTRQSIINIQFKKVRVSPQVDVDEISQRSEGYSGAELVALCRNAALCAMRANINAIEVMPEHFEDSFKMVLPRTEPQLLKLYEKFARGDR
ncbi:unnamed protein product [Bursaphelenchus xylophilus]|uniref:(pine wood nematode) hypothetical protein n=1 Tax=Bursaphelenchus xylophilus TaxID=6326 RepID=A0A1I7RLK8_BURXY|nr:unnamed protein product [Bursaphelenchus xylophilus]CAG9082881.1 unnamed protein product [Bursaphelenchus xylophilus]